MEQLRFDLDPPSTDRGGPALVGPGPWMPSSGGLTFGRPGLMRPGGRTVPVNGSPSANFAVDVCADLADVWWAAQGRDLTAAQLEGLRPWAIAALGSADAVQYAYGGLGHHPPTGEKRKKRKGRSVPDIMNTAFGIAVGLALARHPDHLFTDFTDFDPRPVDSIWWCDLAPTRREPISAPSRDDLVEQATEWFRAALGRSSRPLCEHGIIHHPRKPPKGRKPKHGWVWEHATPNATADPNATPLANRCDAAPRAGRWSDAANCDGCCWPDRRTDTMTEQFALHALGGLT